MKTNYEHALKPLMLAETAITPFMVGALPKGSLASDAHNMSDASTGILTIRGVLWPSTYSSISSKLDLMAQNYDKIILDINSPGGLVAGVFDLSDKIYSMRSKVRLYAFANESCYSAAYCIASACHKVFIARSAGVGSVGVITTHVDQSVLNDRVGLNITRIYAGSKKNDFSPHSPLSPRAMEDLQKAIDADYEIFCSTVGRNRGMLAASVKATEAGIFHGQDAVDIGFVDSIKSEIEAFKEISTGSPSPTLAKATVSDSSELLIENAKARAAALQTEQAKHASNTTPQIISRTSYLH